MSELKPCRLVAFTPFPPGSFPYSQSYGGKTYNFPDIGLDIKGQALVISRFRKANGLPRPSLSESLDDLNVFTCQRIGCDPRFCSDGTRPQAVFIQQTGKPCATCGAKLK